MSHIFQRQVQKNPVRDYRSVEKDNSVNLRMPLGMRTNSNSCCIPNGMLFGVVEHFFYRAIIPNGIEKKSNYYILFIFHFLSGLLLVSCLALATTRKGMNVCEKSPCKNTTRHCEGDSPKQSRNKRNNKKRIMNFLSTQMTQIKQIFTDRKNLCSSVTSVSSVCYCGNLKYTRHNFKKKNFKLLINT